MFALLAVGETMVILTRNVDLSVGSVLGLVGLPLGQTCSASTPGSSIVVVFLVGLGDRRSPAGVANGLLITIGRVPSLVVTLAMLYIIRGIDILIVGGERGRRELPAELVPQHPPGHDRRRSPSSRSSSPASCVSSRYYLRSFRSGRDLYAIGSEPRRRDARRHPDRQARVHSVRDQRGLAGLAGVLWAARYGTIDSTAGTGYELQVIAAVVVGGVAIFGGSGTRRRRRARGAAAEHDQLVALRARHLGLLGPGDRGLLLLAAITLDRVDQGPAHRRPAPGGLALAPERAAPAHGRHPGQRRSADRAAARCCAGRRGSSSPARRGAARRSTHLAPVPDQRQPLLPVHLDRRDRDHDAAADASSSSRARSTCRSRRSSALASALVGYLWMPRLADAGDRPDRARGRRRRRRRSTASCHPASGCRRWR